MRPRVLLVDDDADIRAVARLSLERLGGWSVVAVGSGREALDAAGRDGPFDAVLLDVAMPEMDGPGTLAQLRAGRLGPEVPVVFLTAKSGRAERERLAALGAAATIAKPFDPRTLPDEFERACAPS